MNYERLLTRIDETQCHLAEVMPRCSINEQLLARDLYTMLRETISAVGELNRENQKLQARLDQLQAVRRRLGPSAPVEEALKNGKELCEGHA